MGKISERLMASFVFLLLLLMLQFSILVIRGRAEELDIIKYTRPAIAVIKGQSIKLFIPPNIYTRKGIEWTVSDTSKASINKKGTLTAKKTGWLVVKARIKKTGEITRQKVLVVDKHGTVNNQEKLDVVLSSSCVTKIKIKTDKYKKFIINGSFPEKELLIVDAPKSEVIIEDGGIREICEIRGKVQNGHVIDSWPIYQSCKAVVTQFFAENEMEVEYINAVQSDDFYEQGKKLRICFKPEEVRFLPIDYNEYPEKIRKGVKLSIGDEVEIGVNIDEIGNDYLYPEYIDMYEKYKSVYETEKNKDDN